MLTAFDTTGATSGAYAFGDLILLSVFSGIRVTWSLVYYICFLDHFSFDHNVVWPPSIYRFWLPLWYLRTLLDLYSHILIFFRGQIELAITTCDEAFKICQQCTPTHYFLDDIRLLRFHCHVISKDWSSADEVYELIMAGRERYSRDTERGELMMKAMLHSLFLTEGDDWDNAYNDLQVEIRKLRDLAFECNDFDKYHLLQLKINHGSRLFTSKRVDTQDIHKQKCRDFVTEHCHLCKMSRFDWWSVACKLLTATTMHFTLFTSDCCIYFFVSLCVYFLLPKVIWKRRF